MPVSNPFAADLLTHVDPLRSWVAYRDDPVRFFREVLGIEPWARQQEVLEAIVRRPKVAVRSGHKVGKSLVAAGLGLWWVCTRSGARVVMTSASYRQVRSILWRELRSLHAGARRPIGGDLHQDPDIGLQFPDGREIVGFSTDAPERMQGLSGRDLLFILDEASGIPEPIFEAIEGNRAGGAQIVMFSNPTMTSGTFYEAFTGKRDFWHPIHISAEESPNVVEGRIAIPGLATADWVDEKRREWGENSPLYQVRVLGDFPSQGENAIIPLTLVEAASERWDDTQAEGDLVLGVDVARFGDDETVIFPIRGKKAFQPVVLRSLDGAQVAGKVLEVARSLKRSGEVPCVHVDSIGIGASVADFLKYHNEVKCVGVNVATSATIKEYALFRDQVWFSLKDWLKEGGAIPQDSKLEAELVAATYCFDARGRVKVEPKEEIKKRLGRSPDRADALALAAIPSLRPLTRITWLGRTAPPVWRPFSFSRY